MALIKGRGLPPAPPTEFMWLEYVKPGLTGKITVSNRYNAASAAKQLKKLVEWAYENNYGLTPYQASYFEAPMHDGEVWSTFTVSKNVKDTEKHFGDGTFTVAGKRYDVGTLSTAEGRHLACTSCYKSGLKLETVRTGSGNPISLCPRCYSDCRTCDNKVYKAKRSKLPGVAADQCDVCSPLFKCGNCETTKDKKADYWGEASSIKKNKVLLCRTCESTTICGKCGVWQRSPKLANCGGVKMCTTCSHAFADKERVSHEKFDEAELPSHKSLVIPSLPARPFRTVSIETEVDGDRTYFGQTMYNCGLVRVPNVEAYGTAVPEGSEWAAFLKHDGSVTGGELITYLLDLSKREHADALLNVLSKVRSLAKVNKLEFNPNCGGHIHIDAHNFDEGNIWKLLTVWNYLEDVTYRLAGSGHKYGHRTQVPGHDRANHGGGYSASVVKGPWGVKSAAGKAAAQQNRMCGLNFQPFFASTYNCGCGANRSGKMGSCTCNLGKCTIEWRVWNSQANPRILHAWIAYMQAMHAIADGRDEPSKDFEDSLPALGWTTKAFKDTSDKHHKEVRDRLEWMFGNFVLTEDERDSLVYTIKQSDMVSLGDDYIDSLKNIVGPNANGDVKPKPRNPNNRKKRILIKTPKPGDDPFGNLSAGERERLQYHIRRRG